MIGRYVYLSVYCVCLSNIHSSICIQVGTEYIDPSPITYLWWSDFQLFFCWKGIKKTCMSIVFVFKAVG